MGCVDVIHRLKAVLLCRLNTKVVIDIQFVIVIFLNNNNNNNKNTAQDIIYF